MSTNKTPNLALHSWEETDRFSRTEINENFTAIDAAVGGLQSTQDAALAGMQSSQDAALGAMQAQVDALVSNTQSAVNAALAATGNTRLVWGEYAGHGGNGSSSPTTLTFDGKPLRVSIVGSENPEPVELYRGRSSTSVTLYNTTKTLAITWGNNSVSWYVTNGDASYQLNARSVSYFYIALLGD